MAVKNKLTLLEKIDAAKQEIKIELSIRLERVLSLIDVDKGLEYSIPLSNFIESYIGTGAGCERDVGFNAVCMVES